jgi:hypothetical protein
MQSIPRHTRKGSVAKRTRGKFKQTSSMVIDAPKKTRRKERVDCATQTAQRRQITPNGTRGKSEQTSSTLILESIGKAEQAYPDIIISSTEGGSQSVSSVSHDEDTEKFPDESYAAPAGKSDDLITPYNEAGLFGTSSGEGGQSVSLVDHEQKNASRGAEVIPVESCRPLGMKPKHMIGALVSKVFKGDGGDLCPFAGEVESYDEVYSLYKIVYEDGDAEELTYEEVLSILVERGDAASAFTGPDVRAETSPSVDHPSTMFDVSDAPAGKPDEVIITPCDGSAAGNEVSDQSVSLVDGDQEYEDKERMFPDVLYAPASRQDVVIETDVSLSVGERSISSDDDRGHDMNKFSSPQDGTSDLKSQDETPPNLRNAIGAADDKAASATPEKAVSKAPLLGKSVVVSGLHAKPELNGRIGFAGSFDDSRGRYVVSLEDGGGSFKIRPDNLAVAPPRVETDGSSNISATQSMSEMAGESLYIEVQQRMENNIEIIRKAAQERETLMVLIQDKTAENATLISLMIELSDKQALLVEELARKYTSMNKELENARTLKREIVHMHARIMGEENLDCGAPAKQRLTALTAPRQDAESSLEGALSTARLDSDAADRFDEHVDCATETECIASMQLIAASTTIASKPGEAVSVSADVAEVHEAVSVSADVAKVHEAVAGSNVSLLHLFSPFLSLLAGVGEAAAGR